MSTDRLVEGGRHLAAILIIVSALLLVCLFVLLQVGTTPSLSAPLLPNILSVCFVLALVLCLLSLYRWEILRQDYRRQRKLHHELTLLQEAVETMEIGLTITDISGNILYVNKADAKMHGYEPEELVGRESRIFAPSEVWRQMTMEEIRDATRRPREAVNIRRDGSTFPVQLISNVVRDPKGKPIGFVTSCEDISERKRAEEERQQSQRRLRQLAQHLDLVREEERSRAAREIYHDIGTPLTMLKLDLSMLEKYVAGGGSSDQLGRLHRMFENIDSTIDMVRSIAHELSPSSLVDQLGLIAAIESDAEVIGKKTTVRLVLDLPAEEPPGSNEHKKALFWAWKEAVTNSLRHAKPTAIRTSLRHQADKDKVVIRISDDGIGLSAELQGRLGFALDALIERVGLVGGTVEVEGASGEGMVTTVTVAAGGSDPAVENPGTEGWASP